MKTSKHIASGRLDPGWAELRNGRWEDARVFFEDAVSKEETPEAWDGFAWACWWLEDGAQAMQARERAYRLYKEAGDRREAARMAIWLANDHIDFRGEGAVAQGWLRAR